MPDHVRAEPTKRFFVEMLVRDISFEDAILDLLDNSVDGYVKNSGVQYDDLLDAVLGGSTPQKTSDERANVDVQLSEERIVINDDCGGMGYHEAKEEIFLMGRKSAAQSESLGVYGIGLKRAVFKLGRRIQIVSRTSRDGFVVAINTPIWQKDQTWEFPIRSIPPARARQRPGTRIVVKDLNDEIRARIRDPRTVRRLLDAIGGAHWLFLTTCLSVKVGETEVKPRVVPLGSSEEIKPSRSSFEWEGVKVTLIAGLASRANAAWNIESAGWYVLCNGRAIVFADKTNLTEWGSLLPQFVSKFRGFVGMAFFESAFPERLPWTTTKRGLNPESPIYQRARPEMVKAARPVLQFLDRMYQNEDVEEPPERKLAEQLQPAPIASVVERAFFAPSRETSAADQTVSIQFKIERGRLEAARRCLRRAAWSAGRIGQYAFDYMMKHECGQ